MLIDVIMLDSISKRVKAEAEDVRISASKMDEVSESIESGWKSDYTAQFLQEIDAVKQGITKVSDNLVRISQTMNDIVAKTNETEENISQLFGINS